LFLINAGGDAADIRVAAPCIHASHPDTPALDVINDSLGGGFTSRLLDELRVNLGITYDVASVIETYRAGGWLSVETSTAVKNARIAIDAILKSMAEHRAIGPTSEDVQGAKAFFSVDTARLFEAPDTLAETLAQAFGNGAGPESLAKYQERLDAIDRPRAAEILEKHFPTGKDDVVIIVTGPAEKLKRLLVGLGEIQVLSIGERPR
jgi:zinc protease